MHQIADAFKKLLPLSFTAGREGESKTESQGAQASSEAHSQPQEGTAPEQNRQNPRRQGSRNSHPNQNPKRPRNQIPRIEGFVEVGTTPDGKSLCFHGLLVPGRDREDKLRNRYVLLDHYADQWFADMCWDIVNNQTNIPVRVRVSNIIGENRCYVRPCTKEVKQVMNEWGRLKEEMMGHPISIEECKTKEQVCEFVYRKVAESKNLKIVRWIEEDFTALAVNRSGVIFRMSGADTVSNLRDSTKSGLFDVDSAVDTNVTVFRAYRI